MHSYVLNNPLRYTDPTGLLTRDQEKEYLADQNLISRGDDYKYRLWKIQNWEMHSVLQNHDIGQDISLALPGTTSHFEFTELHDENGMPTGQIGMRDASNGFLVGMSDITRLIIQGTPYEWDRTKPFPTEGETIDNVIKISDTISAGSGVVGTLFPLAAGP